MAAAFVALQLAGMFDSLGDLAFVLKVVVFIYLSYHLYILFRGGILFGAGLIGAAFLIFFYSISTTVLLILFAVFVLFGTHLQMLIDFGLGPIYHAMGKAPPWRPWEAKQFEAERLSELEKAVSSGAATAAQIHEFEKLANAQGGMDMGQQQASQLMLQQRRGTQ